MRAIIVGAVDSTRVAIRCLAASPRWQLAAVVTLPSEAAGRHSDFVDLTEDAATAGAELVHAKDVNADEVIERIAAIAPDYLFVIGWSQLCGERFLQSAPGSATTPLRCPGCAGEG
jgi:methionyl-tRNA formyltransferase